MQPRQLPGIGVIHSRPVGIQVAAACGISAYKSGKAVKTEIEFSRSVPEAYGTATFLDYRCRITEEAIPQTP